MTNLPTSSKAISNYNRPIYGIHGKYSLSEHVSIPYFNALVDLKRVSSEIKTHEETSPSLNNVYNIIELYQRSIDQKRVEIEIVDNYLKLKQKIKFFNSLTVVLFPKNVAGKTKFLFEDLDDNYPPLDHENELEVWFGNDQIKKFEFGGVQYMKSSLADLSRLKWDLDKVDAVAVDGQHRLKAIKIWLNNKNNELLDYEKPTSIPVIFLLLHETVGFKVQNQSDSDLRLVSREIFSDLNKNARPVDPATLVILDDRSLEALCLRTLITENTCEDSHELLPLSLLRWKESNYRFDNNYFLNSIINLHLIIKNILDIDEPKDSMDKKQVHKYINKINDVFSDKITQNILWEGEDLLTFYHKRYTDDESEDPIAPFVGLPVQFLNNAVEAFRKKYSWWILKILLNFKPYKDLINYARDNNLIEGVFSQYHSQPQEHQNELQSELESKEGPQWHHKLIEKHIKEIEKIKKWNDDNFGEQWAFKNIFQKSLFKFSNDLLIKSPQSDKDKFGNIDQIINFFNLLYDSEILRVHYENDKFSHKYWSFIALHPSTNKIQVNNVTSENIYIFLKIIYYTWIKSTTDDKFDINETIKYFMQQKSQRHWPGINDYMFKIINLFEKNAHIILGKDRPDLVDDNEKKDAASSRLKTLMYLTIIELNRSPAELLKI